MKLPALIGLSIVWAGLGTALDEPSCKQIDGGVKDESFVQRTNCARKALMEGNYAQAYELLHPLYQRARIRRTDRSALDSQTALRTALFADGIDETETARLIDRYGIIPVYTARVLEHSIDPATGKSFTAQQSSAIQKKYPLEPDLVNATKKAVSSTNGSTGAQPKRTPSKVQGSTKTPSSDQQASLVPQSDDFSPSPSEQPTAAPTSASGKKNGLSAVTTIDPKLLADAMAQGFDQIKKADDSFKKYFEDHQKKLEGKDLQGALTAIQNAAESAFTMIALVGQLMPLASSDQHVKLKEWEKKAGTNDLAAQTALINCHALIRESQKKG